MAQVLRRGEELGLESRRAHLDFFLQAVLLFSMNSSEEWGRLNSPGLDLVTL